MTDQKCGVCNKTFHRMDTFYAPAERFDFEYVCKGCTSHYLKHGSWGNEE